MSLGISLSAALTGLTATAKAAGIVSSNVANATTEGYGVRRLELASQSIGTSGAGVRVVTVLRQEDMILLQDRRLAESNEGGAQATANFARTMEGAIGIPGEPGALSTLITGFERALIEASANPESTVRLSAVVTTATDLTNKIGNIAADINEARQNTDQEIERTVISLNTALEQIAELNGKIRRGGGGSRDVATLEDARQKLVDIVAQEIPLRQLDRGRGEIALMGLGGIMLLDGSPAELGFSARTTLSPAMTIENGALSGLTVNGNPIDVHSATNPLRGGRLEALFDLRDVEAPKAQARVDAFARDLIERFQDPNVDPSILVGEAGLFSDSGLAFDVADELGISSRIALNPAVDPAQGGALHRLRDGVGATIVGPLGDSQQLERFSLAMSSSRLAGSGDYVSAARSAAGFAADFLSMVSASRANAEIRETFNSAQAAALREKELERGVDTDSEMQRLLMIEQAYAANAKVIEVVGKMLEQLQRIT